MPRQTRSRAAANSTIKSTSDPSDRDSGTGGISGPPHVGTVEDSKPPARDNPSITRASQVADAPRGDTHFGSPRAQSRERARVASAPRQLAASPTSDERVDWQDRGRTLRLSPSHSQEHLFSPPPYKVRCTCNIGS